MPPTVDAGAEVRRLEGEALAVLGELRLERRASAMPAGAVTTSSVGSCSAAPTSAAQRRAVAERRLAVEVLAAAAADASGATGRVRVAHALDDRRDGGGPRPGAQKRGSSGNASRPRLTCMRPYSAQRTSVGITLPGLSRPAGSKARLTRFHLRALGRRELDAHRRQLLDADAVLAGDGAAHRDAELEDLGAERLGAMQLVAVVGVEQDQRMQVAVAGVEDVDAAQRVPASPSRRSRSACRRGASSGSSSPCTCSRG